MHDRAQQVGRNVQINAGPAPQLHVQALYPQRVAHLAPFTPFDKR